MFQWRNKSVAAISFGHSHPHLPPVWQGFIEIELLCFFSRYNNRVTCCSVDTISVRFNLYLPCRRLPTREDTSTHCRRIRALLFVAAAAAALAQGSGTVVFSSIHLFCLFHWFFFSVLMFFFDSHVHPTPPIFHHLRDRV